MEVIEKETIKEVPVDCNGNRVCGGWGYGYGPYANEAIRGNFASKGNIDIENILAEMMENVMTTQPFTFNTSVIGDIEVGGGHIKLNLPFTNKRLVLNMDDLEAFKEMLITKK